MALSLFFCSREDYFAPHQPEALPLFRREGVGKVIFRRLQSRSFYAFWIVLAISPHVIVLPKEPLARFSVGKGGVGERFVRHRVKEGHLQDGEAARPEHARDFPECLEVIVHVLQDVVAQHDIEQVIGERHLMNIHFDLGEWRLEIGRNVLVFMDLFEAADEARLRSDVQDRMLLREEGRFLAQEQPDEPVPFE